MSNTQRGRSSSGRYVLQIASATVVEIGDLIYRDPSTGKAKPASDQSDQGSEAANQRLFAQNFAGVSEHQSIDGDTADILIDANPEREFVLPCASETHEVGDYLGADEQSGGTALEDAVLVKVNNPADAIFVVTRRDASAATTVYCKILRSVFSDGAQAAAVTAQIEARTLTGAATLTLRDPSILLLDPGGADRTVTLPTEASATGRSIEILNTADADETLQVLEDAGVTTIVYVKRGGRVVLRSDGTSWRVMEDGYFTGDRTFGPAKAQTLAADRVLDDSDQSFQELDPGGAGRNVDLPAAGATNRAFLIVNTADMAEDLTVRLTGGGATIVTVSQSESAIVFPDGTVWKNGSLAKAT